MHILAGHRQVVELAQHMAAQFGQHGGIVGTDIKYLFLAFFLEGVQPYRKHRQLAGTAGGLVQAALVGIKPGRRIGIDVAHPAGIFVIGSTQFAVLDILRPVIAFL
ncbi:hypothetical protein D3C73_733940 [compost metagenome]